MTGELCPEGLFAVRLIFRTRNGVAMASHVTVASTAFLSLIDLALGRCSSVLKQCHFAEICGLGYKFVKAGTTLS